MRRRASPRYIRRGQARRRGQRGGMNRCVLGVAGILFLGLSAVAFGHGRAGDAPEASSSAPVQGSAASAAAAVSRAVRARAQRAAEWAASLRVGGPPVSARALDENPLPEPLRGAPEPDSDASADASPPSPTPPPETPPRAPPDPPPAPEPEPEPALRKAGTIKRKPKPSRVVPRPASRKPSKNLFRGTLRLPNKRRAAAARRDRSGLHRRLGADLIRQAAGGPIGSDELNPPPPSASGSGNDASNPANQPKPVVVQTEVSGHDFLYGDQDAIKAFLMPTCRYLPEQPGFLSGCAQDGCKSYATKAEAVAACDGMGRCGGVTRQHDGSYQARAGNEVTKTGSGEMSTPRRCRFRRVPPPAEYTPYPGTDIDSIGSKVDGRPTIYVSVASYRDSRCTATVESLFERAKHPDRVFVGIVQQNSPGSTDADCLRTRKPCSGRAGATQTLCRYARQIRLHMVQAEESLGPTFGRHRADRLYRGEMYAMQIDAHSRLTKHWDVDAIAQHRRSKNDYAVMTNYPSDVTALTAEGRPKWTTTPMMCAAHFEGEILRFDSNLETTVPARLRGSPVLQPYWGAGASFSRGHRLVRVPYDCCLDMIFTGEEISMAARMWTNGYDLYTFHHSIVFHQYGAPKGGAKPPMFWENERGKHRGDAARSANRIKKLFGLHVLPGSYSTERIERYGMGSRRPLAKYLRLWGIDFARRKVVDNCPVVTTFRAHDALVAHLRPDGKGIDYSSVPDSVFHPNF